MKVAIKRNWNAPGDLLLFVRNSPVEVDDTLLPYLPSDAVILQMEGSSKPLTRNETRKKVLIARRDQKLDTVTAELPHVALTSDEALLAEINGTKKTPKTPNPGGLGTSKEPTLPTKADLEANLATAQANLENAKKKLADAKSEPDKGVAKADLALAEKGLAEAEGAILSAEDD